MLLVTRLNYKYQSGWIRNRGFTLIELMVTLAIAAILITVAVPSFQDATLGSKLGSYANTMVAHMTTARGEAIKRNAVIKMCASSTGTGCASSGGWAQGWIVFRDIDNDGVLDSDDILVQRQSALPDGINVTPSGGTHLLSFQPSGVGVTSVTLTICRSSPKVGTQERVVTVTATGRASVSRTTAGICS